MQRLQKHFYEFGLFRIDTEERRLLHDGKPISLTAKVFDLLLVLVENKGHTLGKEELMRRVWADTFVEENNLSRNISMLRKTLGDDLQDPRFIKTVPKRGYRFEPDVRELWEDEQELIVERRTNYVVSIRDTTRKESDAWSSVLRYQVGLSLLITGILIGGLAWAFGPVRMNETTPSWITENNLRGTRNAGAFELYERGRELWQNRSASGLHEATLLLEHAVEKDPNFALAHAALADAYAFDARNWRRAEDVARRAIQLDGRLGEPYASIGFVKLFWEWNPGEAEIHFKKAAALSPDYATAHQWYAINLAAVAQFNEALTEIERALELEPNSVAINADMCHILYFLRRYDDAEAQCSRALAMDGNSFNAHSYLYMVYTAQGKYPQAIEEFIKREQLSANNASIPADFEELRTAFDRGGIEAFWRKQIRHRERFSNACGYTVAWYHAQLDNKDAALHCLQAAYENREFEFVLFFADPVFRKFVDDPRYVELAERWISSRLKRN